MPSPKFCDLTPSDAAAQVKRMLGHAPSQQAAHTFWRNLTTLGQIQQNQRLEIDSQGVFRLESTALRKLNTLPFRSASRSITELHPAVLAVLYRAQIEAFFPTPQLSKELGSKLPITEYPSSRDGNRRTSISRSIGFVAGKGVVATPQITSDYQFFGDITDKANKVVAQLAQAKAGLANMLTGYRSQSSWFNSKDAQAECVNDLAQQAERPLMPFANSDTGVSIAQCIAFKFNICENPEVQRLWNLDSGARGVIGENAIRDFVRIINNVRSKHIVSQEQASERASRLLWGHHVLRDGWVYHDLDFDLFDDDINDNLPCSRVLEEQVDETQCNVAALKQFSACLQQQKQRIIAFFP
jgi:hypothetical protein